MEQPYKWRGEKVRADRTSLVPAGPNGKWCDVERGGDKHCVMDFGHYLTHFSIYDAMGVS